MKLGWIYRTAARMFRRKPDAIGANVKASLHADGVVLLDVQQGLVYTGNATAALIWSGFERALAPEQIADGLCETFGISRELAMSDISAFTATLQEMRLLPGGVR
ncbi:MAG: PqqD family protein [Bryobacterales bacterium]|nr:PqqD family protein [Bryobacterales bacterium]